MSHFYFESLKKAEFRTYFLWSHKFSLKKMKISKNSLRGLVARVNWSSWARRDRRKKGRGRGGRNVLSPQSPSLFPFFPILYPFWRLLCRLVVDCCCCCFFSFLFWFLKLSYSSAASLRYSSVEGNDIACVACLPGAPFSLFAPIC